MIAKIQDIKLGGRIIQEVNKITIEYPQIEEVEIDMYATRREHPVKVYGKLEDGSDFCLTILALATKLDTYNTYDKSKVYCFGDWE